MNHARLVCCRAALMLFGAIVAGGANAASIGGVVTSTGGSPIPDGLVRVYNSSGTSLGIALLGSNGTYSYSGLAAGTYFVRTEGTGHLDELFDGVPCAQRSCTPTSGTPIVLGASTNAVASFVLEPGGAVSGAVLRSPAGTPITNGLVRIYTSSGTSLGIALLENDGTYRYGGLAAGTYRARTESTGSFDELWDNLPCAQRNCVPTSGSAIAVATNTDTVANFSLVDGGAITGFVSSAGTGLPIGDGLVRVYSANGTSLGIALLGNAGDYRYSGLAAGTYYARTEDTGANDELWNNFPCPQGSCSATTGTPISVGAAAVTANFELTTGGAIAGTVTASVGGAPITDGLVRIYNATGTSLGIALLENDGSFVYSGLAAGTYYARTESTGYYDEIWNNIPCAQRTCTALSGSPIAVSGSGTTLANFALEIGGSIAGTVVNPIGQPVPNGLVRVYTQAGTSLGIALLDNAGAYEYGGLAAGSYFARTEDTDEDDELWLNLPCAQGACSPTSGTPISVSTNLQTTASFILGGEAPLFFNSFE